MNVAEAKLLLQRIGALLPPLVTDRFDMQDVCIISSRVVIEIAARFGLPMRPLPVALKVANPEQTWIIGFGYRDLPLPGKYNGHLIAATEELFLDASLGQVARPEKGIYTRPSAIGPAKPLWAGEDLSVKNEFGSVFRYEPRLEDKGYCKAPFWYDRSRRREIIEELVGKIAEWPAPPG